MKRRLEFSLLRGAFAAAALVTASLAGAPFSWGWSSDPNGNVDLFAETQSATYPHLVKDGRGGAIVVSGSGNGPASAGIHVQRVDANGAGNSAWPTGGIFLAASGQENSQVMSDGAGGSFLVWEDYRADGRTGDIYLQRIDSGGTVHAGWPAAGLAVCSAADDQSFPQIAGDGAGGAVVVWQDLRSGTQYDIYAQRISGEGKILWSLNGVAVSVTHADKLVPQLTPDGVGGAVVVWEDYRSAGATGDIYAQRLSADGNALWSANGVGISKAVNDQVNPLVVGDGASGALVIWEDYRNDPRLHAEALEGVSNIFAQRIGADGSALWSADGIALAPTAADQDYPQLVEDAAGGALVVWEDNRSGSYQIWAQRVAPDGSRQFTGNGVQVSLAAGDKRKPQLIADDDPGAKGALVVWEDYRDGTSADVYAQHISSNGTRIWKSDTAVSTAVQDQLNPQLASDLNGGAIVVWQDFRSGTSFDIFAQRVNADGTLSGYDTATADGICTPAPGKTRPDIGDALRVLQISGGEIAPTADDYAHADVAPAGTPDGKIDALDVIGILRMTLGLM